MSDRIRTLLSLYFFHSSIAGFCVGFEEARAASRNAVCFRQHLCCIPFGPLTNRHRHLFAGLFGCNRPVPYCGLLFFILFLHTFIRLRLSVSVSIRVSVSEGRVPVYLRSRVAGSLSFPLLACSWFKTPVVPPRFPTQSRSNPTSW